MSWTVHCLENSIIIPEKNIAMLRKALLRIGFIEPEENTESVFATFVNDDHEPVAELVMNTDDMEHIDVYAHQTLRVALCKADARGQAKFADLEGDRENPQFWGYEFL